MTRKAWRDPVIESVRRRRTELCKKAGHDIHKLCELVRSLPLPVGSRVVVGKPRRVPTGAES